MLMPIRRDYKHPRESAIYKHTFNVLNILKALKTSETAIVVKDYSKKAQHLQIFPSTMILLFPFWHPLCIHSNNLYQRERVLLTSWASCVFAP